MLTVFFGTDVVGIRQAALAAADELTTANTTQSIIDRDSYTPGVLIDAIGSISLFDQDTVYVIDSPSEHPDLAQEVADHVATLQDSERQFILIEGPLLAAAKKRYEKPGATLHEYTAAKVDRFNTFAFADALVKKDKKSLWMLLQQARASDIATEEIIGVLWWQLKTLLLAQKTDSPEAAGVKSFPYQKAKRALSTFKTGELDMLAHSLITLYHDGHGGVVDLDEGLERWLLTL